MIKIIVSISLLLAAVVQTLAAQASDINIDPTKIPTHPRLIFTQGEEDNIKKAIETYPGVKNIHDRIMGIAQSRLSTQPSERTMAGKRLSNATEILNRICHLAYAYRMTGDIAMAQRAEEEMIAVCNFTDWNPNHFLDTGEIALGLALGYDWLFDVLKPETKALVRTALVEKAFKPAADSRYSPKVYDRKTNWNSVCNSGLVNAALAIYEDEPTEAETIIRKCVQNNPKVLNEYAPDGGYPEGFAYWSYGTTHQILLCEAMMTALGTDFGLSKYPGFMESAKFIQHMIAPSGLVFNYSDGSSSAGRNLSLYWFAEKLNDPSIVYIENKNLEIQNSGYSESYMVPCFIVFVSRVNLKNSTCPDSNFWVNNGTTPVFTYRSGWDSAKDAYLGVKGGKANTSHAHMDAGSFIYEKDGIRWAVDLGNQSYEPLESIGLDIWDYAQTGDRWVVYLFSNLNHNTLTLNDKQHTVSGSATILEIYTDDNKKGARIDMRKPLNGTEKLVIFCGRSIYLDENNDLHVDDEINPYVENLKVQWVMMTNAKPTVSGNVIYLEQGGKTKVMTLPEGATPYAELYEPANYWDMTPAVATYRVGYTMTIKESKKLVTYSVTLKDKDSSGINEITGSPAGMEETDEYYNLQGIKIEKPEKGIVIRRYNGKTEKILIK